jgi:transcription-repair coupling factor (superfamily II helicase)
VGVLAALCIAALASHQPPRCLLVVQPTIRDAEDFAAELSGLLQPASRVCHLPAWESIPEGDAAGDVVGASRLSVVHRLAAADLTAAGLVVVASLPALLQPIPSRAVIAASTRVLRVGDEVSLDELSGWLLTQKFERVTAVELPGEFSIHGGILDVFPATESDPVRLEFFGDEIESIRSFDAESQRRLQDLGRLSLTVPPVAAATADKSQRSFAAVFGPATESLADVLPPKTIVVLSDLQQSVTEGRMYQQRLSNPAGLYSVDSTLARITSSLP